jgi:hypothetical protein
MNKIYQVSQDEFLALDVSNHDDAKYKFLITKGQSFLKRFELSGKRGSTPSDPLYLDGSDPMLSCAWADEDLSTGVECSFHDDCIVYGATLFNTDNTCDFIQKGWTSLDDTGMNEVIAYIAPFMEAYDCSAV